MTDNYFTKLWTLKLGDFERAFILAVISMPLGILYDWATITDYKFDWRSLVKGAVMGGTGYLIKNLGTGSNGRYLTNK